MHVSLQTDIEIPGKVLRMTPVLVPTAVGVSKITLPHDDKHTQTHKGKTLPAEAVATGYTVTPAQYGELASLTTYFCGGVLWDHRVSGELWMEDAAVRVSVHGQTIQ